MRRLCAESVSIVCFVFLNFCRNVTLDSFSQVANGMTVNVGMTVATSTDEEHSGGSHMATGDIPVVILESRPHSHGHTNQPQMHPHLQHHQLTTAVSIGLK